MGRLVVAELILDVDAVDRIVDAILNIQEIAHNFFYRGLVCRAAAFRQRPSSGAVPRVRQPPADNIVETRFQELAEFYNRYLHHSSKPLSSRQAGMPRFHFHIQENDRFIEDEEGQEFDDWDVVRREAVATVASIAKDVFVNGTARRVTLHVNRDGLPFMKVSISLDVENHPLPTAKM